MTAIPNGFVDRVPSMLRELPQWVVWRLKPPNTPKGKPRKVPFNARTGQEAKSNDSSTWSTFDEAHGALLFGSQFLGVGFMFGETDGFVGVDLDNSIDPATGKLKPWAQAFVDSLNSYTEVSPSGTGVKIFVKGEKPKPGRNTNYEDGKVEVYGRLRFFTVTGQNYPGTPPTIEPRHPQLAALIQTVFPKRVAKSRPTAFTANLDVPMAHRESRCRSYLQKCDDAISGQGGHNATFRAACECFRFGLDEVAVWNMMVWFNDTKTGGEAWSERELDHKIDGARAAVQAAGDFGSQLQTSLPSKSKPLPSAPKVSSPMDDPKPQGPALPRPSLILGEHQLHEMTSLALDALGLANDPPNLFVRYGQLCDLHFKDEGDVSIRDLDRTGVRKYLSEGMDFFTGGGGKDSGPRPAMPPLALSENILAQGAWPFPKLAGVVGAPILRHDGSICVTPGYDPQSKLYYHPAPGLEMEAIPESPSPRQVALAVEEIYGLIGEFPYVDSASRSHALAFLLTLLMRPVIDGNVPMLVVDAPEKGTGKTLLVQTLLKIATGQISAQAIPDKQNEDEWRKKITSVLKGGSVCALLDNFPDNTNIQSPNLAAVLTSGAWSDRILNTSDQGDFKANTVWVVTGNNLRLTGDMPRRCYLLRLDACVERPEQRTGYTVEEPADYAGEHRGRYLHAAFTIIRGYYAAGKPRAVVPTMGSFEQWAKTIGGVLAFAGVKGFLLNNAQVHTVKDDETQEWLAFFECWWSRFGSTAVVVDDIMRAILHPGANEPFVLPDCLLEAREKGEGSLRRSLGRRLSRYSERVIGGCKLVSGGRDAHKNVHIWRLIPLNELAKEGNNPQNGHNPPLPANNPQAEVLK
jgi:hypothetical protein